MNVISLPENGRCKRPFGHIGLIVCLLLFFFFSCNSSSGEQQDDCPYDPPTAVFPEGNPQIAEHQFRLDGQVGSEQVVFANGIELELIQSGCTDVRQEFRFRFPKPDTDLGPEEWLDLTVAQFNYMGSIDFSLQPFQEWARAMSQIGADFKLGEPVEVGPGFYVRIDRILSSDHSLLLVELFQNEPG